MTNDTETYSSELARDVLLSLSTLVDQFEKEGHQRKHVLASIRYAMEPAPVSDEQLNAYVAQSMSNAAHMESFTEADSHDLIEALLDAAARSGVAPSRVYRLINAEERSG